MRHYIKLSLLGILFGAICLTMFFKCNPGLIIPLLLVWHPMEKEIDKITK